MSHTIVAWYSEVALVTYLYNVCYGVGKIH